MSFSKIKFITTLFQPNHNNMKLIQLRPNFWFNPDQVTNAWIDSEREMKFQLSSDTDETNYTVKTPQELSIFCRATGIQPGDAIVKF